jgi:glycosyltransferase involved in cell wall biosynthesis
MRIAYFAEIFPSGSETWVHHEIEELQRRGCTVQVFATHPRPSCLPPELQPFTEITTYLPEFSVPLHGMALPLLRLATRPDLLHDWAFDTAGLRLKGQVLRDLGLASRAIPWLGEFKPDVVFAHFGASRTNLAMFASMLTGTPFAFKMHAGDVFTRPALLGLKTRHAAAILTISDCNIRYIREHYPDVDSARLRKHACGIPLDRYPFRADRPEPDNPTLLAVGRLVKMKGFDTLLRASRILFDQGFAHRLVVIGDGPQRPALESLCAELALTETTDFKGYCSPDEVRENLLAASLFALPAVWDAETGTQDGIPVALMEAMAFGIPAVSTTTSGIPELIEDNVSGFLAVPGDPASLAAAIRRCCDLGSEEQCGMLRRARLTIERAHDIRGLTGELHDLLAGLKPC